MLTELRKMLFDCDSRKIAFIENDIRITYSTLSKKSMQIAGILEQLKENKICIFLPDGSNFVFALSGILLSGKIAFPINVNLTYSEIYPLLNFVPSAVITSKNFSELFEKYQSQQNKKISVLYIEDLFKSKIPKDFKLIKDNPNRRILFLNTSGTTGNPKIVMLREKNISACVDGYLDKFDFSKVKNNKFILASPFSTSYGLMIILACLKIKYTLVILKHPFNITNFLQIANKYKVELFEGGSSVILMLWQLCKSNSSLKINWPKCYGFGGSKVSYNVIQDLKSKQPKLTFWQGYGMTEASPLISKLQINKENEDAESVGTAIKDEVIKISYHNKLVTTPNVSGEIVVKGKNIMLGYYKNKQATDLVLKNGYLYTGDLGFLDKNKNLYIIGRIKNIIIVRGMNVSVEEVECIILNSGLAKDCIVYSKPYNLQNETLCANVVPISVDIQPQMIIEYCLKHLANYKVPYNLNFVNSIEKTISGKNILGNAK